MPQRISCESCRAALYEGEELKPPYEITELYEGKCPKCGRRLSSVPVNVDVRRIE